MEKNENGPDGLDGNEDSDDEDDDDDDFECDIEKYVPFEEKLVFAEKLKSAPRDILTAIVKLVIELQPQAIDDFGNSRVQLKIDMIEKEAFLKCQALITSDEDAEKESLKSAEIMGLPEY